MLSLTSLPTRLAVALLVAGVAQAQRVVLPRGTGGITPTAEWTVLRAADIAQDRRASDPGDGESNRRLLALLAELRAQDQLLEHAVLHADGSSPDSLRLVHAYSDQRQATTDELLTDHAINSARGVLEPALASDGAQVEYVGYERAALYETGSLLLQFELRRDGRTWRFEHHIVPAGSKLQYFDVTYAANDTAAAAAIDTLLRTFDGASEEPVDPTLRRMIIAGIAGAVAGVATALVRRRRLMRRHAQSAATPDHADANKGR